MVDEARHRGILIDIPNLKKSWSSDSSYRSGDRAGLSDLIAKMEEAKISHLQPMSKEVRWQVIGEVITKVQTVTHRHHTAMDRIEDVSAHPVLGGIMGFLVLILGFGYQIRWRGIITHVTDPIFENLWMPVLEKLNTMLGEGPVRNILIGTLIDGEIDLEQSLESSQLDYM